MHEVAALFFHHADDATTQNNLATLRHYNPGMPVVPLSNWGVTLPGGFHARQMVGGWRKLLPSFRGKGLAHAWKRWNYDLDRMWIWRNVDLIAYMWIAWPQRTVQAKRWVIIEWDMYCSQPIHEWYAGNWNDPISSTSLQTPGQSDFYYFNDKEQAQVPAALKPHLNATNPWAGMLFSDEALNAIAKKVKDLAWCNAFCENRVATVAKSLGYQPKAFTNPQAKRTLRSLPQFRMDEIDGPGVWHRVKHHDPLNLTAGFEGSTPSDDRTKPDAAT